MGRPVMRNPETPGWSPAGEIGERTTEQHLAQLWAGKYYERLIRMHEHRVLDLPTPRGLAEAVKEYLPIRERNQSENTWKGDKVATGYLLRELPGSQSVFTIKSDHLQQLVDRMTDRELEPSTINSYRISWQSFFKWACAGEHDPTVGLKLPALVEKEQRWFTTEELLRLRTAADEIDGQRRAGQRSAVVRLALELAISTGCRQAEIFAVRWEAINPKEKTVRITEQVHKERKEFVPLKGKRARTVLVMPEWWAHHRRAIGLVCGKSGGAEPVSGRARQDLMLRMLDKSGINEVGVGWHAFRHTYARNFILAGGRFEDLQLSLGHESIITTQESYGHFHADDAVRFARSKIYGEGSG